MKIEDYKYVVSCITKKDRKKFRRLIITGGEALLHPKIMDLILLMRKDFPKAEIQLFSNGRLLKKLPHHNLRIFPNIKNIILYVSDYVGWNDDVKKKYDDHYKLPNLWIRIISKFTINNKFIRYINLDYRFPIITKKIRRLLLDPLKRGNVYFSVFAGFWDPYDDPKLSNEMGKAVRDICCYNICIIGRKLYNCCLVEQHERYYNTDPVNVEFDKNWKKNFFKIPTWKACIHCRMGAYQYKFSNIDLRLRKNKKYIDLESRRKIENIRGHE